MRQDGCLRNCKVIHRSAQYKMGGLPRGTGQCGSPPQKRPTSNSDIFVSYTKLDRHSVALHITSASFGNVKIAVVLGNAAVQPGMGKQPAMQFMVSIPPRKVSRCHTFANSTDTELCFHSTKEGFKGPLLGRPLLWEEVFPFHQGRFQGRSATSAPMFIQYSTSQSEKSVQGEKAASPCKQAVMQLSQTCVDPPPFSRHRGATHSLQEHTSKI